MAKQLNVNLAFTADTGKAKAQLQDLQNTLNAIANASVLKTDKIGLTKDINSAVNAASQLKIKLSEATTPAGKLDLGKFNQSLKESGKDLNYYANNLKALGPSGQLAFQQLAQSISLAEVPLKKGNKLLEEFGTTLKNTVRWQFSSSLIHNFVGGIQTALYYAQDLNKSLNDIRIVTGQSTDQMADFAKNANEAAKNLSATTTDYTNAALIYYQQGLSDQEVKERTDLTIKMANASGQSAEVVSDQLTAIWNNYDDGSQSLEHFADVLTKLGAETASSSEEISTGLEKFAAIGDTIGLSYDNAAAALATVTATTRQSAEVVGTAFKTIFARIQGLKLGETLEDGTSLNKYSQALQQVGISIYDANGGLKNMDNILAEMGDKWKVLNKDQQVALAQTVAGTRQYTQLVALMDNFDFYEKNLSSAQNADGSLQAQADIYADSWEAASNRVQAATEKIYQTLLDDNAFIEILNVIEDLITEVGDFLDVIGGLKGFLLTMAPVMMKVFGPDISSSIDRITYNIQLSTKKGKQAIKDLREESINVMKDIYKDDLFSGATKIDISEKQASLQQAYLDKTIELESINKTLTEEQKKQVQTLLDENKLLSDQYLTQTKILEQKKEESKNQINKASFNYKLRDFEIEGTNFKGQKGFKQAMNEAGLMMKAYRQNAKIYNDYENVIEELDEKTDKSGKSFKNLQNRLIELSKSAEKSTEVNGYLKNQLKQLGKAAASGDIEQMKDIFAKISFDAYKLGESAEELFDKIEDGAQNAGVDMEKFSPILQQVKDDFEASGKISADNIQLLANFGIQVDEAGKFINNLNGKVATFGDVTAETANAVFNFASVLQQASRAGEIFTDPDTDGLQRLYSAIMLVTTAIQTYKSISSALNIVEEFYLKVKEKRIATETMSVVVTGANTLATKLETLALKKKNGELTLEVALLEMKNILTGKWITIAATAITATLAFAFAQGVSAKKAEQLSEKLKEQADQSLKNAETLRDTEKVNKENLQTMEELYASYEKGEDVKEQLDQVTKQLAEAYNIEGAALAKLTGQYEDYRIVADKAYEAHQRELQERLKKEKLNLVDQEELLKDIATTTTKEIDNATLFNNTATINFSGNSHNDNKIQAYINQKLKDYQSDNGLIFDYDIDLNNSEQILDFYDKLSEAYLEIKEGAIEGLTLDDIASSKSLDAVYNFINKLSDQTNIVKDAQNVVNDLDIELGKIGNEDENFAETLKNVKTLEEYQSWVERVSSANNEAGKTADDLSNSINVLTSNSINPSVKALKEQDDALNAVVSKYKISKDSVNEFFLSLPEENREYFWQINFSANEESWNAQLELIRKKAEYANNQLELDYVQTAQESLKKTMDQSDWDKIKKSGIDWGNKEKDIIDFSDFVKKTYEEQVLYLEELNARYVDTSATMSNEIGIQTEDRLKEIEKEKQSLLNRLKIIELTRRSKPDDKVLEQQEIEVQLEITNLESEKNKLEKEFDEIEANIQITLDIENQQEIKELQKIFDKITNSIEPLTDIFDALGKGIKKTFDESGKSVWSFSREAVQAVEQLYPGFMQNLDLLKDGTFAVTDEMYQSILNMENGALLANTESTAGRLKNLAEEAYAKADMYENAAEAAYALASSEKDASFDAHEAEVKILEAAVQNEQDADKAIVQMTEDKLGALLDSETQYRTAIEATNNFQSESTAEAADNVAFNTAAGASAGITNLDALRDAAYKTAQQVSQIGGEPVEIDLGKTNLQWDAKKTTVKVKIGTPIPEDESADTLLESSIKDEKTQLNSLEKSIAEQLNLNYGDGINKEEKSAIYKAIGDSFQKTASQWREAGNKAMAALSTLFGSINSANADLKGSGGDDKSLEELAEYAERYHELNEEVKMHERLLDSISKEKSRAFGKDKIKLIEDEIKATEKLKSTQEKLLLAQQGFLKIDQANVLLNFENAEFDEYGNINNFTQLKTQATNDLIEQQKVFNASAQTDADKEALKNAEELYEKKIEILDTYEETLNAYKEQEQAVKDIDYQLQDLKYEKLTYNLELELIVNENEMKELDYYFGKMEGDIYKSVEAFAILQDKINTTSDNLSNYEDHYNSLEKAIQNAEISKEQYIEGLQDTYNSVYENLEALNELDKQMLSYYGETYDLALEKIGKYTSEMEGLNSVLESYKSIMSLLGKDKDFKVMGTIIEGQVKVAENSYEVSREIYNNAKEERDEAYDQLLNAENDIERELLQQNYDKANEQFLNAQEDMLSKAEQYGQLIKEALVNSMEEAAKEMEKALSGVYGSFEHLQEIMSLHSTNEEEYLTNTNKLYETNKMLNQIAQDMEKTDNRASKAKYNAFAQEIEQLQEKGKLSKLELEIAQAKYNMLQMQIALEDAQNAKSMVRLTRDSEGNYGYVYTADQDKVNKAEQDLADAENDLYNIRLDATNDYAEKKIQAEADLANKLIEIDQKYQEGAYESEVEYQNARTAIIAQYTDLITSYSNLYAIASGEDARVVQDAWTSTYRDIILDGENWQIAISNYTQKVGDAFENWAERTDILTEQVGSDLDDTKSKVDDITNSSEALKDTLIDDVVPAMSDTLKQVRELTEEYASQRDVIFELIEGYEGLAKKMNQSAKDRIEGSKNQSDSDDNKSSNDELQEVIPIDSGKGPGSTNPTSDGILNIGDEVVFKGGPYYSDSNGSGASGSRGAGKKVRVDRINKNANYPIHVVSEDSAYGWLREDQLSGFNTGGYTGAWGAEGKLAVLHEKELVLNAQDTENLLATVSILRELTKAIDLNATWASMGIGSLNAVGVNENKNILEQQVEIHAEFPNATDRHEIEEAFSTLINRASQYANRF